MGCVIAGGGPAGVVLALLLARAGVEVTLLEKHTDFLRDFRGDTVHPSTLQVLAELGLGEDFHRLPHHKAYQFDVLTDDGYGRLADLRGLPGAYDYIAFVPQWDLLNLLTAKAATYPNFRLLMRAEATDVIVEQDLVRGLRYRDPAGEHEIRAELTIAADGRGSTVRAAAGLVPKELGAPMDVVWFSLPRAESDPGESFLRLSTGRFMVSINRGDYWQLGYVIPKGGFERLREAGIEELRESIGALLPYLADRTGRLHDFDDVSVLTVALNRLRRWHRPGLLCIGDAAHAMSPVFGVGINLAVQDAVATANLLAEPLREGDLIPDWRLGLVQRRRMWPTKVTQAAQRVVQNQLIRQALNGSSRAPAVPDLSTIPVVHRIARRFLGLGIRPEHVRTPEYQG